MSKRVRKTSPVFGAFLVLSGIAVIAAVAYVSRSETDTGSTTTDTARQDTTQDTTQATSANNQNATTETLFAGDDNSNADGANINGANTNVNTNNNTNNNINGANTNDNTNANTNDNTNNNDAQGPTNNTTTNINPGVTLLASAESASYGEIIAYTFQDQDTVNVMPLSFQSNVFNELGVTNQTTMTVAGQLATQYQVTSAKDGSLQTIVQIEYQDMLYDFRGSDEFLQHLDAYIQFTN